MSKKLSRVLYSGASLLMLAPVFGAAAQPITASAKRRPVRYSRRARRPRYRARRTRRGRKANRRYARKTRARRSNKRHARKGSKKNRAANALFKRMHKNLRHARRANKTMADVNAIKSHKHHMTKNQAQAVMVMNHPHHARHQKRAVRRTMKHIYKNASVQQRNAQINRAFHANNTLGHDNKALHKAVFSYYNSHNVNFTTAINHVLTQHNISFLNHQTKLFNGLLNHTGKALNAGHYAKAKALGKQAGVSKSGMRKAQHLVAHKHMTGHKAIQKVAQPVRAHHHAAAHRVLRRKTLNLKKSEHRLSTRDQRQLGKLYAEGVFKHHSKKTDRKLLNTYLNDPQLMYIKRAKHATKHSHRVYTIKATNAANNHKYTMAGTNKQQVKRAFNDDKTAGAIKTHNSQQGKTAQQPKASQPIVNDNTQEANLAPKVFFDDTTPQEVAQQSTVGYNKNYVNQEVNMINNDQNLSNTDKELLLADEESIGQELAQDGVQTDQVNPTVYQALKKDAQGTPYDDF